MKFNIHHLAVAALAVLTMASQSCTLTGDEDISDEALSIRVENALITADGKDFARIIVKEGDREIKEGVTIYNAKTNKPENLTDLCFSTTTPGTYRFWASYKTKSTIPSEAVSITAISGAVPQLPKDPSPEKVSFERKVFFTQFTGNTCGWCPYVTRLLREYATVSDNFVHAACHSYKSNDPAYFSGGLPNAMAILGYPTLIINLDKTLRFSTGATLRDLQDIVSKELASSDALAGLCASTILDGEDLIIRIGIKAANDGEYRIGAWILEDCIYAKQINNGASKELENGEIIDFNTHNNCLRATIGQSKSGDYFGSPVSLKKGETAEQSFIVPLYEALHPEKQWIGENCHVVVYVTTPNGSSYKVNNVIDCPANGSVAYKYN